MVKAYSSFFFFYQKGKKEGRKGGKEKEKDKRYQEGRMLHKKVVIQTLGKANCEMTLI